uniref:Ubiquitin-associated domain-containing family protein n=1 Tax=Rhizophora mucronata TaxID=61149 RepID=A0A2P2QNP7_RHIMU
MPLIPKKRVKTPEATTNTFVTGALLKPEGPPPFIFSIFFLLVLGGGI